MAVLLLRGVCVLRTSSNIYMFCMDMFSLVHDCQLAR